MKGQHDASELRVGVSWSQVVGRKDCRQLSGRNAIPRILLSAWMSRGGFIPNFEIAKTD